LLLCHGTVCVVGKMRDLILQLSKSSIYSTKPHKVKPGITGLAQINGWRGETDTLEKMEKRIEYDLLYIRGWSIWLDLKIIFLTVFKGFINKSAY
ncbi:sugar transferase, partial [Klebsiella pneumoniae]|uniref:sugar transferase n=1 Tax=Klebsiella pneumoniae TaxID=573 RepID=UPI00210B5641